VSCACAEERCSSETLQLRCPTTGSDVTTGKSRRRDHVIAVSRAWYGRMRPARRCISGAYAESLGCRADVTAFMHSACSGRANCTLLVATMDSVIQPCPKDFKSYLEITYQCIQGRSIRQHRRPVASTGLVEQSELKISRLNCGHRLNFDEVTGKSTQWFVFLAYAVYIPFVSFFAFCTTGSQYYYRINYFRISTVNRLIVC